MQTNTEVVVKRMKTGMFERMSIDDAERMRSQGKAMQPDAEHSPGVYYETKQVRAARKPKAKTEDVASPEVTRETKPTPLPAKDQTYQTRDMQAEDISGRAMTAREKRKRRVAAVNSPGE